MKNNQKRVTKLYYHYIKTTEMELYKNMILKICMKKKLQIEKE